MTYPHGGAGQIWRDGNAHNPDKSEIRDWGRVIEGYASAAEFFSDGVEHPVGTRVHTASCPSLVWDVVSGGEALTHPVSGIKLLPVGAVYFEHFGAAGEGGDDTAVFQAAGNWAGAGVTAPFSTTARLITATKGKRYRIDGQCAFTSPIKFNLTGAQIDVRHTHDDTLDGLSTTIDEQRTDRAIFMVTGAAGTVAAPTDGLVRGVEIKGGDFFGLDTSTCVFEFRRVHNPICEITSVAGMGLGQTFYHPDAPMVEVGTGDERPDVTQNLWPYISYGGRFAGTVCIGTEGAPYATSQLTGTQTEDDFAQGACLRPRWIFGVVLENLDISYYRQGIISKGGNSRDGHDGGNYVDVNSSGTLDVGDVPRDYYSLMTATKNHVSKIVRGGIWGTNSHMITAQNVIHDCGDYGLHNEGGGILDTGSLIKNSANGIGTYDGPDYCKFTGTSVIVNEDTPWPDDGDMFTQKTDTKMIAGGIDLVGVTFLHKIPGKLGVIKLEKSLGFNASGTRAENCRIDATGTNQGNKRISGLTLQFTDPNLTTAAPFTAVDFSGIKGPGDDYANLTGVIIDASTITLPDDCTGVSFATNSAATTYRMTGCEIRGNWDVPVAYAKNGGGGQAYFIFENNRFPNANIYDLSTGNKGARALFSGNKNVTTGAPIFPEMPSYGTYAGNMTEALAGGSTFGGADYASFTTVHSGAGPRTGGVYDVTATYAKYDCVTGSDGNAYRAIQDVPAGVAYAPVVGSSGADYWIKFGGAPITFNRTDPVIPGQLPAFTNTQLSNASGVANTEEKFEGSAVYHTGKGCPVYASGPAATASWTGIDPATGAPITITPS